MNNLFVSSVLVLNSSKSFLYLFRLSLNVLFFHLWKYLFNNFLAKPEVFLSYIVYTTLDFKIFTLSILTLFLHLFKYFLNKSLSFLSLFLYNLYNLTLNLLGFLVLSSLSKNSSPFFRTLIFLIKSAKSYISLAFLSESYGLMPAALRHLLNFFANNFLL